MCWHYEVYFLKLHICLYLRTKFQVSSIFQTSCRRGRLVLPRPTSKRTLKGGHFDYGLKRMNNAKTVMLTEFI